MLQINKRIINPLKFSYNKLASFGLVCLFQFFKYDLKINSRQKFPLSQIIYSVAMSRTKRSEPTKPKFDTKPYERPGLTETDILEIKESFDIFDREHTGLINPSQIRNALASLGPECKNQPIYQVILDYNAEGSGCISFEEFIHLLTPRLLEEDTRQNIDKIFALFDSDKTGFISLKDLRRVAWDMGQDLSEEDLRDMIKRGDQDGDGRVSQEEFFNLMNSLGA